MIAVIDYGAGNLRSVCNALTVLGAGYSVTNEPAGLKHASAILLPGVGHFGQMIEALDAAHLGTPLRERIQGGTPYLGICLGLQALCDASEEAPGARGLGLLSGVVRRFTSSGALKVPHMGWSAVQPGGRMYYFAHSYYVPADVDGCAASACHGIPFAAVLRRANLSGCQFHPEKSGAAGLDFLRSWVEACRPSA